MASVWLCLSYSLLVYVVLTALLISLSAFFPKMGFYGRLLAAHMCLIVAAAYGVVISILLRLVGYGRISQWAVARLFQLLMRLATGVTFEIQGQEILATRPAVFVSNHQTELDVLMLGAVFPKYCSVTAKKSLSYIPIFGWFMALSNTVFIDRTNRHNAMAAFDGAAAEIKRERQSVFIFPEGTRSYYSQPDMLPFKKGAFHLAIQAQVPIVPVVVANYSNVLHLQSRRFEAGQIPVRVLSPIPTTNMTAADVDDLAKQTRDRMLSELVQITGKARAQGATMSKGRTEAKPVKASGVEYGREKVDGQIGMAM